MSRNSSNTMAIMDILQKIQALQSVQQRHTDALASYKRQLDLMAKHLYGTMDPLDAERFFYEEMDARAGRASRASPARASPARSSPARSLSARAPHAARRRRRQTINYGARARQALSLADTSGIMVRDATRQKFQQYLTYSPDNFSDYNKSRISRLWSKAKKMETAIGAMPRVAPASPAVRRKKAAGRR